MEEKKNIVIKTVCEVALLGCGLAIGYFIGKNMVLKKAVKAYENGFKDGIKDQILFEDRKTRLLYELKAECIGD